MNALERWSFDPDQHRPTEVAPAIRPASAAELEAFPESPTRGEAYADTRQSSESGWDPHQLFEAPRAELAQFRTERAGLPDIGLEGAARYVEEHRTGRRTR